jgi:UDP-N-acetylglucosamine acyltransferase
MKAHPSAIIDPRARIAEDVEIGPFCLVGAGVSIGPGSRLGAHVMIQGSVVIGRNNVFHPQSKVGSSEGGRIEIGDANIFREYSHVDAPKAAGETRVGSRNRFGVCVAVGSGCRIGNDVHLGGYALLGDSCIVEDGAQIEAQVVIGNEEPTRIGQGSRVRSMVHLTGDVPPFLLMDWDQDQGVPRPRDAGPALEGGAN